MAWKVANYNALKREADGLRTRYQNLQKVVSETNQQLANFQLYAKEVSLAYGIKQKLEGPSDISAEGRLLPSVAESLQDYDFLKSAAKLSLPGRARRLMTPLIDQPNIWPLDGRLVLSAFGNRTDPFSGEGAFHKGVDISSAYGTPVRVTADGIVVHTDFESGYGRLVVGDHGNGMQTYYAHLSRFEVHTGQEVRRGEIVGRVGSSGRVTAPHLHYEVRRGGVPQNPYRYLAKSAIYQAHVPNDLF